MLGVPVLIRRGRGLTLLETVMWMVLLAGVVEGFVWIVGHLHDRTAVQSASRVVSGVADTLRDVALQDITGNITASSAAGGHRSVDIANLPGYDSVPTTGRGRVIRAAQHATSTTDLVVLAWTVTPIGWVHAGAASAPRAGPGIETTGMIDDDGPCRAGFVCGPGIQWNATATLAQLGAAAPGDGDIVAARWLRIRSPVSDTALRHGDHGLAALNHMATPLDANGYRMINTGEMTADDLEVAQTLRVEGTLGATGIVLTGVGVFRGNLDIGGNLDVDGELQSALITATNLDLADTVSAAHLEIDGVADMAGGAVATGALTTPRIDGNASVGVAIADDMVAITNYTAGRVITNMAVSGELSVDSLTVTRDMRVSSCTGTGCR